MSSSHKKQAQSNTEGAARREFQARDAANLEDETADTYRQGDSTLSSSSHPPEAKQSMIAACAQKVTTWISSTTEAGSPKVEEIVKIFQSCSQEEKIQSISRIFREWLAQENSRQAEVAHLKAELRDKAALQVTLQQRDKELWTLTQELKHVQKDLDMMREERIKEGEMSGLIQKTAEQNELEIMIKSYFAHDLQSFVTPFQGDVSVLEDNISKQLAMAFEQARHALVQQIVQFCLSGKASSAAVAAFRSVTQEGKRQEVLMTFLSADVYINPKKQTLSEAEWDVRKRIIFLKSSFLNSANRETSMTSMEMAVRDSFAFLREEPEKGNAMHDQSAVDKFLIATITLIQHMLMSESPFIPWTGLKKFDPMFVEVDPSQLRHLKQPPKSEEAFRGWKIVSFKRPILLSCSHSQVKIYKGKVRVVKK